MNILLTEIGHAISSIDSLKQQFRNYQPGIGPFGEPQLVGKIRDYFNANLNQQFPNAKTGRTPDFLIPNLWAIEFKIVRPFGNNGNPAENWSENLLHPYSGNESSIGDIYKLQQLQMNVRKGIIVVSYEHKNAKLSLLPLLNSFDIIARQVCQFKLSNRYQVTVQNLVHPVHQISNIYGWEIF